MVSDWTRAPDDRHIVLALCVRDGPGVLARLAGTLTGAGLDILSMDAYTGSDGIVLDIFRLAEAPGSDRMDASDQGRIDEAIRGAIDGSHDVDAAVLGRMRRRPRRTQRRVSAPPRIRFEGPDALGRTVIEVRADDEPGLVYRLAATLADAGLDISFAKIATEKNQALDVFYVTWAEGRPPNDEWTTALEARLVAALRAPR
jgi:[protein-PII] uridylyltransferase